LKLVSNFGDYFSKKIIEFVTQKFPNFNKVRKKEKKKKGETTTIWSFYFSKIP
jgi:hypothetical protein